MRTRLWEIFTLFLGIAIILAVAKGFPAFGRVLFFLMLNPIGITCIVGLAIWIAVRRNRALDDSGKSN